MKMDIEQTKTWIDELVNVELKYITGRNIVIIESTDWSGTGRVNVSRGENNFSIRFERIEALLHKLQGGAPIHVDTELRSGSNDRSVIETIIANFPVVGYMKPKQGRNRTKNKVIQLMNQELHPLGETLDVSGEHYKAHLLTSFSLDTVTPLSKPFLLLAGISGTGKTRFVREQAKLTGSLAETYCLTSVRPDWHEPSDLLGYVSRLSGSAEFVVTDVLKFIAKAWREILDKGISLSVNEKLLCLQGGVSDIDAIKPYWLCLDEMNLAPVEQYFADYLSVIETRCWAWDEDDFQYSCDPLLKATIIQSIDNIERLREELGFADANYDDAWQHICEYGLSIPFNLIVAGTVNMDETTHGFSRKVIDRALSFDFGDFFPNDFDNFFAPTTTNKTLSYPIYSDARTSTDKLPEIDIDGRKSIAFINAINGVLAHTPFKLAYRALNELLLAVISSEPKEEVDLKAVWDDFLMCKVLPRIEGDTEKLAAIGAVDISILKQLEEILKSEFGSFWNELPGSGKARPDLYRENVDGDKLIHIACRSKEKINWMEDRLTTFGFTSFWP
ncbi:hypothetical protein R0J93_12005 [Pseudoalteromonas sp. SIMBA_148]